MRSTRAAAAVARLNRRSEGQLYLLVLTSDSRFVLRERVDGVDQPRTEALDQDAFVAAVNALGPQEVRRVTKNDAAFAKQLVRKP